jgi:hypothetical protein
MKRFRLEDTNVRIRRQSCGCDTHCDCEDTLYFTVDGKQGYGMVESTENYQYVGSFMGVAIEADNYTHLVEAVIRITRNCLAIKIN